MTGGPYGKPAIKSCLEALDKHFQEPGSRLTGQVRRDHSASGKSVIAEARALILAFFWARELELKRELAWGPAPGTFAEGQGRGNSQVTLLFSGHEEPRQVAVCPAWLHVMLTNLLLFTHHFPALSPPQLDPSLSELYGGRGRRREREENLGCLGLRAAGAWLSHLSPKAPVSRTACHTLPSRLHARPQPRPSSLPGVQQEHHTEGTQVLRVPRGQAEEAPAPGPGVLPPEK